MVSFSGASYESIVPSSVVVVLALVTEVEDLLLSVLVLSTTPVSPSFTKITGLDILRPIAFVSMRLTNQLMLLLPPNFTFVVIPPPDVAVAKFRRPLAKEYKPSESSPSSLAPEI